jgi:DNA primase
MLWMRETESGSFATPERRAALESRIGEIIAAISNEAVRRYYRQDFETRIRTFFAPKGQVTGFPRERRFERFERGARDSGRGDWRDKFRKARETLAPLSPRLGASPIVRGFKSALPPREALILSAVMQHPWLLESHAEEFAELEFLHPDADLLRRAILEVGGDDGAPGSKALVDALARRGLEPLLNRVQAAITHTSDWPAREGAAEGDVNQWWAHVVTLHRKSRTLHRELKDAERALGEEPSEANLAWIRDVQGRLAALEGTEALIEGFGASSGRAAGGI